RRPVRRPAPRAAPTRARCADAGPGPPAAPAGTAGRPAALRRRHAAGARPGGDRCAVGGSTCARPSRQPVQPAMLLTITSDRFLERGQRRINRNRRCCERVDRIVVEVVVILALARDRDATLCQYLDVRAY